MEMDLAEDESCFTPSVVPALNENADSRAEQSLEVSPDTTIPVDENTVVNHEVLEGDNRDSQTELQEPETHQESGDPWGKSPWELSQEAHQVNHHIFTCSKRKPSNLFKGAVWHVHLER